MDCPNCGGPAYDNREKVANGWRGPIAKCKDQDGCGWTKWPPRNKGRQGGAGNGNRGHGASGSGAGPRQSRPLTPLYVACLQDAKGAVTHVLGKDAAPELIVNAAATLFIAASRDGTPLRPRSPSPPRRRNQTLTTPKPTTGPQTQQTISRSSS